MTTRMHRAFTGIFMSKTPAQRAREHAERIFVKLQMLGTRQVRLHRGELLTYPYPAPRGYGTRGLFVGIYTIDSRLEWIEEDVIAVMSDTNSCSANAVPV